MAYKTQLQGLTRVQAEASLTSAGLTKAQRNQVLSALEVTTATKALTAGQIEERIATQLNSAEDAKVITQKLVKAGLLSTESGVTNALTIDILEQAVANGTLTASEMSSIASALGLTVVNGTLSASFKILTASIWATIKAIGVWLVSNPIGWATMFVGAISGIALGMKRYSDSIEETRQQLKETGEQAKSTVNQIKSDFESLSSTTDEVKNRYAELAQEVENLGKVNQSRGTLSTEDYEEFLGLSNQLAELYPQLTKGYDDNGNAILNLSGDVNTIVGSLNDLVSVQQRLANQEIIDQMPDIWAGYKVELEDYNKELAKSERNVEKHLQWADDIRNRSSITLYDENANDLLREAARQAGIMSSEYGNAFYDVSRMASESGSSFNSATWDFSKLTDEEYEKFLDKVSELGKKYEDAVQIAKGDISAANADMSNYINTWLSTEWNFSKMDSNMQNIVKDALLNTDWVDSLPDDVDSSNWDEVSNWLQRNFLYAINNIDNEQIETALVNAFNGNFTTDSLQGIINQLTGSEYGFTEDNPLILYLQTKLTERTEDIDAVKAKLQNEYDGMVEQLSPEDLKIASEFVAVDEKDILTWDELITKIEEYKASLKKGNKTDILFSYDKLSDIPRKLAEVENAYKTAQEALDSYNEKGYYSLDVIDSILSLEDEYINVLVDQNGQLQINESSMNQLAKIKIEAAKASIYQETCEELVRIKTLDTSLAAQELALVNGTLTQSAYETAKALYEEVQAMGGANATLANNVWDSATKKVKLLDNQLKSLNSGSYNVGQSAMADVTEKAAQEAEQAAKDYIEAYMEFQKNSLESGKIDYSTYCNTISNLLKSMFKDGKISAKDYHDYTKQMLETQKSIYDKAISAITDLYDDEIRKIEEVIDTIEKQNEALEEQKTLMENAADAVSDYTQKQLDKYNSLLNVADKLYENEQNRLKDEQDAIQEKIDLLNEENDAKDLQYRKEQALYELERAQNQRTKKLYVGEKGYVFDTDQESIRDAQNNLQDIETEELVSSLEKEQEALQDSIDALQKYRDAIGEVSDAYNELVDIRNTAELLGDNYADVIFGIEDWTAIKDKIIALEEQKEQWSSLSSAIDEETKKQAAINQFGADWEAQINDGRLISYDLFKNQYMNIENQINDNTYLINSYNEKIEYYESLKDEWSSISSVYENETNKQYATMLLGANWEADVLSGRVDKLNDFKNEYISIQQAIANAAWKSANEQIKAAQEAEKGANGNINTVGDNSTVNTPTESWAVLDATTKGVIKGGFTSPADAKSWAVNNGYKVVSTDIKAHAVMVTKSVAGTSTSKASNIGINYKDDLVKYGSGTNNAKKGLNLVGEKGIETFIDNDGNVSLVTSPTLIPMEGGETVKDANETESLLRSMNLVPIQTGDLWKNFSTNMPNLSNMVKVDVPDYSNMNGKMIKSSQQMNFSIGAIHLHEVNDMDTLASDIVKRFPNKVIQAMNRN